MHLTDRSWRNRRQKWSVDEPPRNRASTAVPENPTRRRIAKTLLIKAPSEPRQALHGPPEACQKLGPHPTSLFDPPNHSTATANVTAPPNKEPHNSSPRGSHRTEHGLSTRDGRPVSVSAPAPWRARLTQRMLRITFHKVNSWRATRSARSPVSEVRIPRSTASPGYASRGKSVEDEPGSPFFSDSLPKSLTA